MSERRPGGPEPERQSPKEFKKEDIVPVLDKESGQTRFWQIAKVNEDGSFLLWRADESSDDHITLKKDELNTEWNKYYTKREQSEPEKQAEQPTPTKEEKAEEATGERGPKFFPGDIVGVLIDGQVDPGWKVIGLANLATGITYTIEHANPKDPKHPIKRENVPQAALSPLESDRAVESTEEEPTETPPEEPTTFSPEYNDLQKKYPIGELVNIGEDEKWQVAGYDDKKDIIVLNPNNTDEEKTVKEVDLDRLNAEEAAAPEGVTTEEASEKEPKSNEFTEGQIIKLKDKDSNYRILYKNEDGTYVIGPDMPEALIKDEDKETLSGEALKKRIEGDSGESLEDEEKEKPSEGKYKAGDWIRLRNDDGEDEYWRVRNYTPEGKIVIAYRKSNGDEETAEVEETELDEWNELNPINEVNQRLLTDEDELAKEIEGKPSFVKKLVNLFRGSSAARVATGLVTAFVAGVAPGPAAQIARMAVGALGGGVAGEGVLTGAVENGNLKKFNTCRDENGKLDFDKLNEVLSGMTVDQLIDSYSGLTEIASFKGLKIDAALAQKEKKFFEEKAREEAELGLRTKYDDLKEKFSKMKWYQQLGVSVAVGIAGLGVAAGGALIAPAGGLIGMGVASGMQMGLGVIRTQRQKEGTAYEHSDLVRAIREELASREDGQLSQEEYPKVIQDKRKTIKKKRIGWTVFGALAGGTIAGYLYARTHHAAEQRPTTQTGTTSQPETTPRAGAIPPQDQQGTSVPHPTEPQTPTSGTTPTEPHGGTGYGGAIPLRPESGQGGVPGTGGTTEYNGGMGSGTSEPPLIPHPQEGQFPHAPLPGDGHVKIEEIPTQGRPGITEYPPIGKPAETFDPWKGSTNLTDEIEKAGGIEKFKESLSDSNAAERLAGKILTGLEGKGQLNVNAGDREAFIHELAAKLKLDGYVNADNAVNADLAKESLNPLAESQVVLNHMHIPGAESFSSMAERLFPTPDAMIDSGAAVDHAGQSTIPSHTGAVTPPVAPTEPSNVVPGEHGSVPTEHNGESFAQPTPDTHAPVQAGNNVTNTAIPHAPIPTAPGQTEVIPGVTDMVVDEGRHFFNEGVPMSLDQQNMLLDPRNGYLSKEVSDAIRRIVTENHAELRISNSPGHQFTDVKIFQPDNPNHQYFGHTLMKDFRMEVPQQKPWWMFWTRPETTPTTPNTPSAPTIPTTPNATPPVEHPAQAVPPTAPAAPDQSFTASLEKDGIVLKPDNTETPPTSNQ